MLGNLGYGPLSPMSPMGCSGGFPKGAGKGPIIEKPDPVSDALREILKAVVAADPSWSVETLCSRMIKHFQKVQQQYQIDPRLKEKGNTAQAHALVMDFVNTLMAALSQGFYDSDWYWELDFLAPLHLAAKDTFGDTKAFSGVVKPFIGNYVQDSLVRYRDSERIQKSISMVATSTGLSDAHRKKTTTHLSKCFADANLTAPYGRSKNPSPHMQVLEDFVYGWINDFVGRAWDVLENGVGADRASQVIWVTALFQSLTSPQYRVIPYDVVTTFVDSNGVPSEEQLPPDEWIFVHEAVQQIFDDNAAAALRPPKKSKKSSMAQL